MTTEERVSIELIDASENKDRVVQILSKVKGLSMTPQQIVNNIPCTVATDVPKPIAEKLQGFLEQAGAMVMLESEEDLFSSDDLPAPDVEEPSPDFPGAAEAGFEASADEVSAEDEEVKEDLFGETDAEDEVEVEAEADEAEPAAPKTGMIQQLLASFKNRFRQTGETAPAAAAEDLSPETVSEETGASGGRAVPGFLTSPVVLVIVGFLAGAVLAGVWGMVSIRSLQQDRMEYEIQTAQQIEEHSAALKTRVQELLQETETLKQNNAQLERQVVALTEQLGGEQPSSILPSQTPGGAGDPATQQAIVQSFQEVMAVQTQSLEQGYEKQKQAPCTFQVLLDGQGTQTYAQVVKHFSAKYTTYDIRKSDSLLTPYTAEFKIPFQQEIRTGDTKAACEAASLKQLETPAHHEFGKYYGYWTIQYAYQGGAWNVKSTVIEKNRALYKSAFQNGSPDFAKFRINTQVFPEFGA